MIAFARFATLNEDGWMHFDLPLKSLGNIFGITHIEADTLDDHKIEFQSQLYPGKINRDITKIKDSTEVLAKFTDGNPAVTRATLKKGFGVYINTQADIAYLDDPESNLLREIIKQLKSDLKLRSRLSMEGGFTRARGIDPHILETEEKTLILFSNYLDKNNEGVFRFNLRNRKPGELTRVYPDRSSLNYEVRDDYLSIPLEFKQKEVMILELSWT